MDLAPQPGVHAAHRGADDEPQVVDAEPLGEQPMLRLDHVAVAVVREPGVEAVARLARLAVADSVRQDDVEPRRVERLAGLEQLAGELGTDELGAAPGGPVEDEHGVGHHAVRIPARAGRRCGSGCGGRAASRRPRSGSPSE